MKSSKVEEISNTCLDKVTIINGKEVRYDLRKTLLRVSSLFNSNLLKGGTTMRKAFLVGLVLSLVMGIAGLSWATEYPVEPGTEAQVWMFTEDGWEPLPVGGLDNPARAWHAGPSQSGSCNKEKWEISVSSHASVAQWINWSISSSGWNFRIRKPGTYAANCLTAIVDSNADVLVSFSDFEDLRKLEEPMAGLPIETYYGFSVGEDINDVQWVEATSLNELMARIPYCRNQFKLWIKLIIRDSFTATADYPKTRACNYQDDAKVTLQVSVLKNWIDPETGNFLATQPGLSGNVYNYDGQ